MTVLVDVHRLIVDGDGITRIRITRHD
jgi:hypothetical protein